MVSTAILLFAAPCAALVTPGTVGTAIRPPPNREEMLVQAAAAVGRARADGVNRHTLRLFLPRGDGLSPPDESWEGGIMQLFAACSPLTRDLLRRLSTEVAGVPPSLNEQRLDVSGVDGESVWFAQSSQPEDDCVGLVQPTPDRLATIRKLCSECGARPLLMVNPQWREGDDPFDALSRKGGLLGALGNALGGKAALQKELAALGFVDVYTLSEYVCRGSRICLQLSYPHGWTACYFAPESESWEPLLEGRESRPTYQAIEEALQESEVPFRFTTYDLDNIV